jgi:hypothetical protein
MCLGVTQVDPRVTSTRLFQITPGNQELMLQDPGLLICNSIGVVGQGKSIAVTIVYQTTRTFNVRKGGIVARTESVEEDILVALVDHSSPTTV